MHIKLSEFYRNFNNNYTIFIFISMSAHQDSYCSTYLVQINILDSFDSMD